MAIATMEDLAAVPVGGSVYVSDNRYIRREGGWWSIDTNETYGVIRDRFFTGLVGVGAVVTEDDRTFAIGTTAVGDRYWYVVSGPPQVDGSIPCYRFFTPDGSRVLYFDQEHVGALANRNHGARRSWLREHLGPLPPEATTAIITALLGQIERAEKATEATEQRRVDAVRDRNEALARVAQADRVREVLRGWVEVTTPPTDPGSAV